MYICEFCNILECDKNNVVSTECPLPSNPRKLFSYFTSHPFLLHLCRPKIYVFFRVVDFNVLKWAHVISYHKMITLRDSPFLHSLMLPRLTSLAVRAKAALAVLGPVTVNGNAPVGITELGQCRRHRAHAEILASRGKPGAELHLSQTQGNKSSFCTSRILSLFAVRSHLIFEGTE